MTVLRSFRGRVESLDNMVFRALAIGYNYTTVFSLRLIIINDSLTVKFGHEFEANFRGVDRPVNRG